MLASKKTHGGAKLGSHCFNPFHTEGGPPSRQGEKNTGDVREHLTQ